MIVKPSQVMCYTHSWQGIPGPTERKHLPDTNYSDVAVTPSLSSQSSLNLSPCMLRKMLELANPLDLSCDLSSLLDETPEVTDSFSDHTMDDDDDDDDPLLKAPMFDVLAEEAEAFMDPILIEEDLSKLSEPSLTPKSEVMTLDSNNTKKRRRQDKDEPHFRDFQAGQWIHRFRELCEYQQQHGHCLVPYAFAENPALARWVKRQRYQYKLLMDGEHSTMTKDRIQALTNIGFVWDSQTVLWLERLEELKLFKRLFGHCVVPTYFPQNPQLATWTKGQRRQYKLYREGRSSHMTAERIAALQELGFPWELRRGSMSSRTA